MNEKQFRLPKAFAEKWLVALRSGEYKQGSMKLMQEINNENHYCCLGVAGSLCDIPHNKLYTGFLTEAVVGEAPVPNELKNGPSDNLLVDILSSLNDGISKYGYESLKYQYEFRVEKNIHSHFENASNDNFKLNFSEIADFIEDNVEFYEENNNEFN